MTTTGWKQPLTIQQDSRRSVNGNHACYNFIELNNLRKDDYTYTYIPTSGGIDSIRASPVIYAYNYNFNIPSNATINKIYVKIVCQQMNGAKYGQVSKYKTVKLKTGQSTTDYGVGKNKAPSTLLPVKKWDEQTISYTPKDEEDQIENINPLIVNNTNFGCVFQVIGTQYKKWVMPAVAKLLMNIDYTIPKTSTNITDSTWSITYDTSEQNPTLYSDSPNNPVTLNITYKHKGKSGETPTTTLKSDNLLIGPSKTNTYTVPPIHVNQDLTETTYTTSVKIYPGTRLGEQILTITELNTHILTFNVLKSSTTSITDEEREKYMNPDQVCIINNSPFLNNSATSNGGAMYVLTEHFLRRNNDYINNSAEKGSKIFWNNEEYTS